MRILVQRVSRAEVRVRGDYGSARVSGRIGRGILALIGFTEGDGESQLQWLGERLLGLRIFPDDQGKMNLSVTETGGSVLVVSQFTLYGDASRGRRPSFVAAARPETAIPLYERFVAILREHGTAVETGEFGAMMDVELVNDGPVTLWLER